MSSNVLSRLSKLGAVMPSRRRVLDPSDMEEEENYVPDVSDVAPIPINEPTPTAEGGISPESFDVRANQIIEPKEAEPNLHENVGRALGELARKNTEIEAPIEAEQRESAENISPVGTRQAPQESGFWSKLGSSLNNLSINSGLLLGRGVKNLSNEISQAKSPEGREELARNLLEKEKKYEGLNLGAENYAKKEAPQILEERESANQAKKQEFLDNIANGMENPWTQSVYGSSDEISKFPELQSELREIAGVDWEPEIAEQVKKYEAALDEISKGYRDTGRELDSQVEEIKKRIEANQATDMDKWYVGLSLLLPLVVGGFFGAEAGLSTLGGAAQGLANAAQQKEKMIGADQEALANLSKLKIANQELQGGLELKRASVPQEVRKNIPKDEMAHLVGQGERVWVDPRTGQERRGVEIRPGLVVPAQKIQSKERLERFEKAADKIAEERVYGEQINDMTDDVIAIASKLKDQNALLKGFAGIAAQSLPGALSFLTEDIEWDGRKVNAGQLLEQKLGFLANAYAQANKLGQLDRAAQNHIDRLILNPTKTLTSPQDSITQMLEIRKLVNRGILRSAENAGFDTDLLASEMGEKNRDLFGRLNAKEDQKLWQERKSYVGK